MKVLVICSHFPPTPSPEGGHALHLCENLAALGGDIHLLTSPIETGAPVPRNFHLHPVISSWGWQGMTQIVRAPKQIDPDVILLLSVGWIYGNQSMVTFAPAFLRRAGVRAPFVTQFENILGAKNERFPAKIRWLGAGVF